MSLVKDFLKKNPAVLSKYVTVGFTLVDRTLAPLNKLMQHLLEVQDIDPRTQPGERQRKALVKALDQVHTDEYDADFDFKAASKRAFSKVKAELNITNDQFRKLTDLSGLSDAQPLQVAKAPVKAQDPMDELLSFIDKYDVNEASALKRLTKTINKETQEKGTVEVKRQPVAVGSPKRASATSKAVKTFRKGVFRRINEE